MKNFHYVYRISNIILNKHYYGSRSCSKNPIDDLGIHYFSSSGDQNFILDQINNPSNYKYKVIKIFDNRKIAVSFESKLHHYFDVKNNESFYNRSNQSDNDNYFNNGVGFIFTLSHGWVKCDDYNNNKSRYLIHERKMKCYNLVDKCYEIISYNEYDKSKYVHPSTNRVIVFDIFDNKKKYITTEEYHKNKDRYNFFNTGKMAAFDKLTGEYVYISKEDYWENDRYIHPTKDKVTVYDNIDMTHKSISKIEFENNKNRYSGVNSGKINGSDNPNASIIWIYDKSNNVVFKCDGDFKKICRENNLPFYALAKTYRTNTSIKIRKRTSDHTNLFEGWYARKM